MAYENWTVEIMFADWVDVTADVDTISDPIDASSGETAEADDAAGSATLVLRNPEQRYTPGNVLSDLYPYVRSGRQMRIRETIDGRTYDIFTGRLNWPDVESWVKSSTTEPREQSITLNAVDLVAQLDTAATFVSTLAAHIRWAGGTTLAGYWPLGDTAGPVQSFPSGQPLQVRFEQNTAGLNPTDPVFPSITFRGGLSLPGDDLTPASFQPARDVTTIPGTTFMTATNSLGGDVSFALQSGQVMTIVAWVLSEEAYAFGQAVELFVSPGGAGITWNSAGTALRGYGSDGVNWGTESEGISPGLNRWVPVAVRFGFDPEVIELWMGYDVYAATQTVTTPTPATFTRIEIGTNWRGQIAHVQVYVGAEDEWDHADFLAQYEVGLLGLEQQSTGERIRSVLRYAGVAEGNLGRIDPGVSVMQRAQLASRTPGALIAEAVITERGSFYADGGGLPVFEDRRTLYNI